jgi:hypothetical protein
MIQGSTYAFGGMVLSQPLPDSFWDIPRRNVQVISPEHVKGSKHLICCILRTIKAFREKRNIAHSMQMELLLHLAGTRQIDLALEKMRTRDRKAILITMGEAAKPDYEKILEELGAHEDDSVIPEDSLETQMSAVEKSALLALDV